jgi:hypothetical protein
MSMKIVSGRMVRGELLFHLADCDRQLMDFTVKHDNSTLAMPMRNQPEEITYATKNTLAAHYQVSPRIIGSWRQQGLLSYIKIRNVVRYNVAACDENLCQYPMIN